MKKLLPILFFFCLFSKLGAQEQASPILFIYDASGSMWGPLEGKTKKEIASDVLSTTVGNLPENQKVGLIAYGHRTKGDCDDIEYMVDLANTAKDKLTNAVKEINPKGKTPLARSTTMAINSLKESNTKATIILITDGIESCDGAICKVVSDAKANGIDFKLHIVGFGLKEGEKEQLKCAAIAGDGNYYDAANAAGLGEVLTEATNQTVDEPEGNFSIYTTKNGEAVDAWVKVKDASTKKDTDAARTYRDTAFVYLPPGKYELEIKPLEQTDITATTITIEMQEGETKHQDISFDSGILNVSALNNGEGWDATVRAVYAGTTRQAAVSRTYGKAVDLELNPGLYDVNILILQVKGTATKYTIEQVEVKPKETTPISHAFESGVAMIGVQTSSGDLIDATVNFDEVTSGKNVAGGRTYTSSKNNPRKFILNPGTYRVKIVTLGAHKGNSDTFSITVKAGETVEKIITY
ncbi:MAG: VWA domain-containing protein [Flavobacteriaceae bacterium]